MEKKLYIIDSHFRQTDKPHPIFQGSFQSHRWYKNRTGGLRESLLGPPHPHSS